MPRKPRKSVAVTSAAVAKAPPVEATEMVAPDTAVTLVLQTEAAEADAIARHVARRWKLATSYRVGSSGPWTQIEAPARTTQRPATLLISGELPRTLSAAGSLSKAALTAVKTVTNPTEQQRRVIALCIRPEGATTQELYTTTKSTSGVPWRDVVANCAKRFGYVMTTQTGADRRVSYLLRNEDSE